MPFSLADSLKFIYLFVCLFQTRAALVKVEGELNQQVESLTNRAVRVEEELESEKIK